MNVLFLSELYYPHGSGAELATSLYAESLAELGFKVIVVTNRFEGEPQVSEESGVTVYRVNLLKNRGSIKYSIISKSDFLFSALFRKLLKWSNVVYVPRLWFSAIPFAKFYKKPVVVHLHDYIPSCPLSNIYDFSEMKLCEKSLFSCSSKCVYTLERISGRNFLDSVVSTTLNLPFRFYGALVNLCDAVICVSKAHRDIVIQRSPTLKNKTCFIYNPMPKIDLVDSMGDDYGYFGGLNYLKGFHILRRAISSINQSSNEITVHATKFSSLSESYQKLMRSEGFFIHGRLDPNDFNNLYEKIRAVIIPSVWPEPLPYQVGEAILKGRLVIASKIGGIPELVEGCKGVYLSEPEDVESLSNNILSSKSLEKNEIIELGQKNRETFFKKFDNEIAIKNFVNVIESVI